MKSAEEWSIEIRKDSIEINQGGIQSKEELMGFIKQIQLDAWKQGMSDAEKLSPSEYPKEIQRHENELAFDLGVQHKNHLIAVKRNTTTSL